MDLIFLGTSASTPTKQRNVTALALRPDQHSFWYLFDAGEATQHQILKTPLSLFKLNHIFITHMHGDHIYGLPGLLCSRNMEGCLVPIHIYGPKGIKKYVNTVLAVSECQLQYKIKFHEITNDRSEFKVDNYIIRALQNSHNVASYSYYVEEARRPGKFDKKKALELGVPFGPLYGRLKNGESVKLKNGNVVKPYEVLGPDREGRRIIIGGDNDSPELLLPELDHCDLLIHESTYTDDVKRYIDLDLKHSTAKSVAQTAHDHHIKNLILTHFSVRFLYDEVDARNHISEIENEAKKHFYGPLHLANDLDVFSLDYRAKLIVQGNLTGARRLKVKNVVSKKKWPFFQRGKEFKEENLPSVVPLYWSFICDEGLGKLAKQLRMLGMDVLYKKDPDEFKEMINNPQNQNRIILSRNKRLVNSLRKQYFFYIAHSDPYSQLKNLFHMFSLTRQINPFSRCMDCNNNLKALLKKDVKGKVPPKVFKLHDEFSYCSSCMKIYWKGTHYEQMSKRARRLLAA